MSKRPRRRYPLWVLMSVVFAIVTTVTLPTIANAFSAKLESGLCTELESQLTDGEARMKASGFAEEVLLTLEDEGIHILVYDRQSQSVRFASGGSTHVATIATLSKSYTTDGQRSSVQQEAAALDELVQVRLKDREVSFFVTDRGAPPSVNGGNLESKELFLCGRSGDLIYCLNLPVKSNNAAVKSAIEFTERVSATVWVLFVLLFVHSTKQISKRHRDIADTAARIARLDFSQRCPESFSKELDDLRLSINDMADSLEGYVNALRETNEKLQNELNERIRQQQVSADLIANLAHDLKTPIAIVAGYAEGLAEGVANTPEKQEAYCETILRESEHMQAIVTRILALGRMESGETPIKLRDFDLTLLLNEILDTFQRELERQNLCLTRAWEGACFVHTDFECARQSLINYVQNAVYHINNGNRIEVRLDDLGDRVRVRVINSAAPIPPEEAQRIWEKLYRGDPSRQRNRGEMGLGLSIVRGNMERLGNAYGCENDPDFPGVCFWLELPKAGEPEDGEDGADDAPVN